MNLDALRKERAASKEWKNIAPMVEKVAALPSIEAKLVEGDAVTLVSDATLDEATVAQIRQSAWALRPWRKGPFDLFGLYIDAEWRSNLKYDLIKNHVDLRDKVVADIGCNNGYYMFRMLSQSPRKLVGFDPSAHTKVQFDFINHFVRSNIVYELLGVEHFEHYEHKFDVAFCLGVIYHRSDPIAMLKSIRNGLNAGGTLILDTFFIDSDADIALTPKMRYAKIPNIYFVPTPSALINWCERAGFVDIEEIGRTTTTLEEQRKTDWIIGESLETFLDPLDKTKTVEGYPAPQRIYIKARRA
ncbi:MAG: tRNA methyltransferase [Sulfuricurvum sp. PC08-66]|nr:MAG: tRNA methyltransferase [Sulfuricurvum sp. PC08-66]